MSEVGFFNPSERARQKQIQRERDDERLRNGEISPEILRREVSMFAEIDLSQAILVRRKHKFY